MKTESIRAAVALRHLLELNQISKYRDDSPYILAILPRVPGNEYP